jgi:Zn-dependent protease/CBS domain-containing protein
MERFVRVGKLFGIDITIDVSWIFIFALITWSLAEPSGPLQRADLSATDRAVLGVLGSLLFFASVLLHELAHSLVAKSRGIGVSGIRLFIFGGVSQFDAEARDAPAEAWISAVGPLTSLLLGGVFAGIVLLTGSKSGFGALMGYLAYVNIALAVFNFLPAYPLDGGRVLHSLLWRLGGDRERATVIAVRIGRTIASIIIVLGVIETVGANVVGGLWITFIGWFLLQAGTAEAARATLERGVRGHVAGELAVVSALRVAADATAAGAAAAMAASHVHALPVVLGDRIIGVVREDAVAALGAEQRDGSYVTAVMTRIDDLATIAASAPANDAVTKLVSSPQRALALLDETGTTSGVVTPDSVVAWLARVQRGAGTAATVAAAPS